MPHVAPVPAARAVSSLPTFAGGFPCVAIDTSNQSQDALAALDSIVLNGQLLLVAAGHDLLSTRPVSFGTR